MNFIDLQHQQYFESRRCGDVYRDAVSYLMGLTSETRAHASELIDEDGMKIEGLRQAWQTGTTLKVTRLAFNLWNGCMVENQEDFEADKLSSNYGPSDIFCCSLAPYFWEAIHIRYPEYCQ